MWHDAVMVCIVFQQKLIANWKCVQCSGENERESGRGGCVFGVDGAFSRFCQKARKINASKKTLIPPSR